MNWRATPLVSYRVIVDLIGATTTDTGLVVRCELDQNAYPKGIAVSDQEMQAINIARDVFHGEWNDTIRPTTDQIERLIPDGPKQAANDLSAPFRLCPPTQVAGAFVLPHRDHRQPLLAPPGRSVRRLPASIQIRRSFAGTVSHDGSEHRADACRDSHGQRTPECHAHGAGRHGGTARTRCQGTQQHKEYQ
jgi:hypothetical protein